MSLNVLSRFAATSILAVAACFTAAQDPPPTDAVADAARKTRAEQDKAPKPKKVYTNDDFKSATPAPTPEDAKPTDANATAAKTDEAGKTADREDNDPKSEAYWRKRFAKQRAKIETAEKELEVLQRELDKDQVQYYPDPQKALMQQYTRSDINEHDAKITAKKQQIEDLKKGLSDLEDDLRKAGGDPGWAR